MSEDENAAENGAPGAVVTPAPILTEDNGAVMAPDYPPLMTVGFNAKTWEDVERLTAMLGRAFAAPVAAPTAPPSALGGVTAGPIGPGGTAGYLSGVASPAPFSQPQPTDEGGQRRKRRTKEEMAAARAAELGAYAVSHGAPDETAPATSRDVPEGRAQAAQAAEAVTASSASSPAISADSQASSSDLSELAGESYIVFDEDNQCYDSVNTPEAWKVLIETLFMSAQTGPELIAIATHNNASGVIKRLREEGHATTVVEPLMKLFHERDEALKASDAAAEAAKAARPIPTDDELRDFVQKLAAVSTVEGVVKILKERFGVERVRDIPEDRRAEFRALAEKTLGL